MTENKSCNHYLIRGRVQGVWFRAHTQKKALEFGITGWVKNLPDGQVEVFACGNSEQLKAFEDWLWQGPTLAKVEEIKNSKVLWKMHEKFLIL